MEGCATVYYFEENKYFAHVTKHAQWITVAGEVFIWVSCIIHYNMPENGEYTFALAFFFFFFFNFIFVLKQLMLQHMLIFGQKQYEAVAVVCRVWLGKVLFLIAFARLSWEELIIETNWGRKRTGSIRASSTVSFKLVVGLDRFKTKKQKTKPKNQ